MNQNTSNTADDKPVSFLNEAQLEGKAQGVVKMDLDEAISVMHKIISDEDLAVLAEKSDEDWEPLRMAIYCHDCRAIVPPGISGHGKRMRTVCGTCNSKKISSGREEALRKYYNVEKREEVIEEKSVEKKEGMSDQKQNKIQKRVPQNKKKPE